MDLPKRICTLLQTGLFLRSQSHLHDIWNSILSQDARNTKEDIIFYSIETLKAKMESILCFEYAFWGLPRLSFFTIMKLLFFFLQLWSLFTTTREVGIPFHIFSWDVMNSASHQNTSKISILKENLNYCHYPYYCQIFIDNISATLPWVISFFLQRKKFSFMVFHPPRLIIRKLSSIYVVNTVLVDINPKAQPFLSKKQS